LNDIEKVARDKIAVSEFAFSWWSELFMWGPIKLCRLKNVCWKFPSNHFDWMLIRYCICWSVDCVRPVGFKVIPNWVVQLYYLEQPLDYVTCVIEPKEMLW